MPIIIGYTGHSLSSGGPQVAHPEPEPTMSRPGMIASMQFTSQMPQRLLISLHTKHARYINTNQESLYTYSTYIQYVCTGIQVK